MQPNHLKSLQASGVWPEGLSPLLCEPPYGVHVKPMLIVAMLDRLPERWCIYSLSHPEKVTERCWVVLDENDGWVKHGVDQFFVLFSALVSAGIVKEEA